MTIKLEQNDPSLHSQEESPAHKTGDANQLTGAMDIQKRDRFELLSAYLDGELTAAERRQVDCWLANDPEVQRLYTRLLKLRDGLQSMPVPPAQQSVESTVGQVLARLNQKPKMAIGWGGAAITAIFISALSGILHAGQSPVELASSLEPATKPESLMVALNTPVVAIPKASVSPPGRLAKPAQSPQQPTNQNVY